MAIKDVLKTIKKAKDIKGDNDNLADVAKDQAKNLAKIGMQKVLLWAAPYLLMAAGIFLIIVVLFTFISNPALMLGDFDYGNKFGSDKQANVAYETYHDSKNYLLTLASFKTDLPYFGENPLIKWIRHMNSGLLEKFNLTNEPILIEEAAIFISLYYEEVPEWIIEESDEEDTFLDEIGNTLEGNEKYEWLFTKMVAYFYFKSLGQNITSINELDNYDTDSVEFDENGEIINNEANKGLIAILKGINLSKGDIFAVAKVLYDEDDLNDDTDSNLKERYDSYEMLEEAVVRQLNIFYEMNEESLREPPTANDWFNGTVFNEDYPSDYSVDFHYENIINLYNESGITSLGTPQILIDALNGKVVWPLQREEISGNSLFGPRNIFGGASTNHKGIDIGKPVGTPIYSASEGKVISIVRDNNNYYSDGSCSKSSAGNYVIIEYKNDDITFHFKYFHLNTILVSPGQTVSWGTEIGTVGNTGCSSGPHLHFQIEAPGCEELNFRVFAYNYTFNPLDVLPSMFSINESGDDYDPTTQ